MQQGSQSLQGLQFTVITRSQLWARRALSSLGLLPTCMLFSSRIQFYFNYVQALVIYWWEGGSASFSFQTMDYRFVLSSVWLQQRKYFFIIGVLLAFVLYQLFNRFTGSVGPPKITAPPALLARNGGPGERWADLRTSRSASV